MGVNVIGMEESNILGKKLSQDRFGSGGEVVSRTYSPASSTNRFWWRLETSRSTFAEAVETPTMIARTAADRIDGADGLGDPEGLRRK